MPPYRERSRVPSQPRNRGGRPGDKPREDNTEETKVVIDSPTVPRAWERNPIPVVDPEPITQIVPIVPADESISVKSATPEIILLDDGDLPIEIMTDLIFEDIGGHELIDISRNDLINGETLSYQLIKNLSLLQQQYNPNNIIGLQQTSNKYFDNFPIKLDLKASNTVIYRDSATGNIIIELTDIAEDEEVEVQIATNGIIDEVDLI